MEKTRERLKLDEFNPGAWKTIARPPTKDELKVGIQELVSNLQSDVITHKLLPETLTLSLLHESQTYFQNNAHVFTNGLSLLAMSGLEIQGKVHSWKT